MNAQNYWQLFLETGAPEMYLLYTEARKTEERDVPQYQGIDPTGHKLQ